MFSIVIKCLRFALPYNHSQKTFTASGTPSPQMLGLILFSQWLDSSVTALELLLIYTSVSERRIQPIITFLYLEC